MNVVVTDNEQRWLGHTATEWIAAWDRFGWRARLYIALTDLIEDPDASTEDRLSALKLLNDATRAMILPTNPELVTYTCRVLLKISEGVYKVRWWRRPGLARRRAAISAKLLGIQWMLVTGGQFVQMIDDSKDAKTDTRLLS